MPEAYYRLSMCLSLRSHKQYLARPKRVFWACAFSGPKSTSPRGTQWVFFHAKKAEAPDIPAFVVYGPLRGGNHVEEGN